MFFSMCGVQIKVIPLMADNQKGFVNYVSHNIAISN